MNDQPNTDLFDYANFYDIGGHDNLDHETLNECIEDHLDVYAEIGESLAATIKRVCPITVKAFNRMEVDESWIKRLAGLLTERVAEDFSEDYGGPDGETEFTDAEIARQIERLMPWLRETLSLATVWACEEVGRRTYSAEEVEAIMREWQPGEFANPAPARRKVTP